MARGWAQWLMMVLTALYVVSAWAVETDTVDADRFHTLTNELRCLVCQNESLADSNAPVALDLKKKIRERMVAGESDDQIKRFLVDRYGDFVTYRPPLNVTTMLLWSAPFLLMAIGGFVMWRSMRRRHHPARDGGGHA